ncbi:nuclease [Luminiphilus syltensis NOR5-1B]|uniref:Nuclease n=1 Tax=Luminiphilus syltensis NOR5-1B TaxID=565045 RepID=B8KQU8_9GAMM|nr:thermonuclease family protein [Luminiphilus syltensis]EED35360.1 nuclease [Luminiphilus syltensis NOR5-1B]
MKPGRQIFRWFSIAVAVVVTGYLLYVDQPSPIEGQLPGDAIPVSIQRISDGDSFKLRDGTRVRLLGIDAPELDQAYGRQSRKDLIKFTDTVVYLKQKDIDSYGRVVGVLWTAEGVNVNQAMVCSGSAWWYERYAANNTALRGCQRSARDQRRGLWAANNPVAPWQWRRDGASRR